MPLKKHALTITQAQEGQRLDHVLAEWLPQVLKEPISKGKVRKLIIAGAVYLNGSRVRIASKELRAGAKVEAWVDLQKLNQGGTSHDRPFEMSDKDILFEDEYLIAINKPSGLPTQPTLDEARQNLFAALKKFLQKRDNNPNVYVGLHHRLDRDTSGVILLTKKQEANVGVGDIFSKHLGEKVYHALVEKPQGRKFEQEWTIKNYLSKSKSQGKKSHYQSVRSGGDFAHTDFKILKESARYLYVEARPRTGRTHQIRVHLSEYGMPILGDPVYGRAAAPSVKIPRLMLHAVSLTFPHPIEQTEITVRSPVPEDLTQCWKAISDGPI